MSRARPAQSVVLLDASQPVEMVMTPATLIPSRAGITTAARALAESGAEEIVVVDADDRPLGVFAKEQVAIEWCSDPGLLRSGQVSGDPDTLLVNDMMVPIRARLAQGSTIAQACAMLAGAHCTRAVVVGMSGRLLGVITATAVLSWIAASMRASALAPLRDDPASLGA